MAIHTIITSKLKVNVVMPIYTYVYLHVTWTDCHFTLASLDISPSNKLDPTHISMHCTRKKKQKKREKSVYNRQAETQTEIFPQIPTPPNPWKCRGTMQTSNSKRRKNHPPPTPPPSEFSKGSI